MIEDRIEGLCAEVVRCFEQAPEVTSLGLSGSFSNGLGDDNSDLDISVYLSLVPTPDREAELSRTVRCAFPIRLGPSIFQTRHLLKTQNGLHCDINYYYAPSVQRKIEATMRRAIPARAQSTSFCAQMCGSRILFDRSGWLRSVQAMTQEPYPGELRTAIVAQHWQLLSHPTSSFQSQMSISGRRGDVVGWHHYSNLFIESYFEVLFALNRVLRPGAKRLVESASPLCPLLPSSFSEIERFVLCRPGTDEVAERLVSGLRPLID